MKICGRFVPLDRAIFGWIPDFRPCNACSFFDHSPHPQPAWNGCAPCGAPIRLDPPRGRAVDQVPSGDPIPLWGVPWSNARGAIDSLPRHVSQGIVSPRSYSPSHAPDALHVWALRICTAGQPARWVIWWIGGGGPKDEGRGLLPCRGVARTMLFLFWGVYSPEPRV